MIRLSRSCLNDVLRWSLSLAMASALHAAVPALSTVEAVLDRGGDPDWVGAYLVEAPVEAAAALPAVETPAPAITH